MIIHRPTFRSFIRFPIQFLFFLFFSQALYAAEVPIFADMTFDPSSVNCRDYLRSINAVRESTHDGIYIESDLQMGRSILAYIEGLAFGTEMLYGKPYSPIATAVEVMNACNDKNKLEEYAFGLVNFNSVEEENSVRKFDKSSCWDIKLLQTSMVKYFLSEEKKELLFDLIHEDDYQNYNNSVVFKSFLFGFFGVVGVEMKAGFFYMAEYCSSRSNDYQLRALMEYIKDNSELIVSD